MSALRKRMSSGMELGTEMMKALRRLVPLSGSGPLQWSERLERGVNRLLELNTSTEKEFLVLCRRLQDFYLRAKEIAELSSSVSARTSGEETGAVVAELRSIVDRVKGLEGESQEGLATLTSTLDGFESIRNQLSLFEKVTLNLHMLCNSLRIESARVRESDSGLSTLVEDIERLAASIKRQSNDLLGRADGTSSQIRENLAAIFAFKNVQQGHATHILRDTGESLTSLTERHERSSAGMRCLSERWERISKSIGEVVSSIQFQDITRQRIEHVIETLQELHRKLGEQPACGIRKGLTGRFLPHRCREILPEAIAGCELQAVQLDHGKEEMTDAVKRIIGSLNDVALQTRAISDETKTLSGWNREAGQSYFEELRTGLSALVQVLSEYSDLSGKLRKATGQVSETVAQMSVVVKAIEKIGIDMNMVALNACIHAAHIGEAGLGLGVLAESLHQLSMQTADQINGIASNLKNLISAASGISAEFRPEHPAGSVEGHMARNLEEAIKPIHKLHMDASALLSRMEESGKRLVADIEATVGSVTVHEKLGDVVSEVNADLIAMASEMRTGLPEGIAVKAGGELSEASHRYTMHSEREIHHAFLREVPGQPSAGGEVEGVEKRCDTDGEKKEDLGDNVELF